jgi:hypothetical protein
MGTATLSEPYAPMRGNNSMLASLIIELLITSLLFLLIGWISDIFRASRHEHPNYHSSEGTAGWNQMSRPRKPLLHDDPDAMWRPRLVRRNRPRRGSPWYPLSIR